MNLDAIADYITSVEPKLVKAKSLFVNEMPSQVHDGVLLLAPYHGAPLNHELPGYIDTDFTYVVRSVDYATGLDLANGLVPLMTIKQERALGDQMLVKQMLPHNLPRPYRKSAGGYWEFEVDIAIRYVAL